MRSAAQTYKNVARQTSSPRELEAILLLRRRPACKPCTTPGKASRASSNEALLFNRKLWSVFLSEMTDGSNPMPKDVRQNVANLGLFVMNHTVAVMKRPPPRAARLADQHQPRSRRRLAEPLIRAAVQQYEAPRRRGAFCFQILALSAMVRDAQLAAIRLKGWQRARGIPAGWSAAASRWSAA